MDCLRSGRDWPVEVRGLAEALEGRTGCEDDVLSKKSSPRSESPCFVCRVVEVATVLGCGWTIALSVVLGRGGGAGRSSPNKSIAGTACRSDCA